MTRFYTLLILALMSLSLLACEPSSQANTPASDPGKETATSTTPQTTPTQKEKSPQAAKAKVSAQGTTFKPPITVAEVPMGAYYCEMGQTVHYARGEQGDGKCALCGMKLTHQMNEAADPTEGHDGHSH